MIRQLAFSVVVFALAAVAVWANPLAQQMAPGDILAVTCPSALSGVIAQRTAALVCATLTPARTPAPTLTATPTATSNVPVRGEPCPSWVHDQFKTAGPDGRMYPTWHPPVDPTYGCLFGHEHGADPRSSLANNTMPAFGYVGGLVVANEPHTGFKVFVLNHGTVVEGKTVPGDYRIVFHMGTSGVSRYTTEFHSVQYDFVAQDGTGRFAHAMGMADMGANSLDGSTCDTPRKGGRDFSTLGCADTYEIWSGGIQIDDPRTLYHDPLGVPAALGFAVAAFDPITTRNPVDNSSLIYTQSVKPNPSYIPLDTDPLSPAAFYQGCGREMYFGATFFNNPSGQTIYYTDAYGKENPSITSDTPGYIRQEISSVVSNWNQAYKLRQDFCGNGIHAPN